MNNLPTDSEIFAKLSGSMAEALRISPEKITMEARIFDDLGAESLDILDIRFRIEHIFGFKIQQDELIHSLGEDLSAEDVRDRLNVRSLVLFIQRRLRERVNTL